MNLRRRPGLGLLQQNLQVIPEQVIVNLFQLLLLLFCQRTAQKAFIYQVQQMVLQLLIGRQ